MEIKKFKKLKDNRYQITLKNEEVITLYDDIILKYNLIITKTIDNKLLDQIKKENSFLECYYKAIKYLAKKNRSKLEIKNYLKRFSYETNDIEKTIVLLEEKNYLNEENYIKSYINDQILLTNHGPKKIKRKLIELGLVEKRINESLEQIDKKVWQEKLVKIIQKKIQLNKKDSAQKIKEKIVYYCLNEGYNREDIIAILSETDIPLNRSALEKEALRLYQKLSKKYQENELFYQLKGNLLRKGFNYKMVEEVISEIQNDLSGDEKNG